MVRMVENRGCGYDAVTRRRVTAGIERDRLQRLPGRSTGRATFCILLPPGRKGVRYALISNRLPK